MTTCKICKNNHNNTPYTVKEMYLGLREEFNYFQCGSCGCLQINTIPSSMEKYYPDSYFSFRDFHRLEKAGIRHKFDQWRVKRALASNSNQSDILDKWVRPLDYVDWLKRANLGLATRVLDVGCGNGKMLLRMFLGGLQHCEGADLFIKEDIQYKNGLTIHKADFKDLPGPWDLIMFHHSLEHMENPEEVLRIASSKLSPKGTILVRIPMADSVAFERYKSNWANLDAPRHFFLFTEKSLEVLTQNLHLTIYHRFRDATPSQFILSEIYQKNISRQHAKKYSKALDKKTLQAFRQETDIFNQNGKGDCGGFLIRKSA